MAEVVVSALVNTILDNLNSLPLEEMGLAGSLKTKVENLESSLTTIRAVLHDAEMKQWKSEAIKNWLAKLKQAAYHLEDVLDDFNTDALPCRSKVTTFFSIRNPLLFHLNMARKLKNARQKLDAISGEKSKFHLREAAEEAEIEPMEDRQTSSLVEESEVIGRADEKEKIISMLLTNASHHQDLSVYAICGMGDTKSQILPQPSNVTERIGLCNVKSSTEAKNAILIKKQNLRSLSLSWRVNAKEKSHHRHGNDEDILSGLQPHSSLKKLCIMEYQGVSSPNWMMDLLVPNLVEISLQKCERCHQLPPLGKLQFLKALTIVRMDALKHIDSNLYGETESSFPSLEVLKIVIAPCLEEWTTANGGQHFPLLSSLTIRYCSKLVKLPMLQSLKELQIEGTNVGLLQSLMMSAH
ncbi:hypothetical protein V6N13_072077 [Hibiscus sabdariffa]